MKSKADISTYIISVYLVLEIYLNINRNNRNSIVSMLPFLNIVKAKKSKCFDSQVLINLINLINPVFFLNEHIQFISRYCNISHYDMQYIFIYE